MTEEKSINEEVNEVEADEEVTTEENETKSESKAITPKKRGGEIKDWVKSIIIAAFIAVLLMQLIVPTVVREHSMEPSFWFLVASVSKKTSPIKWNLKGSIVHEMPTSLPRPSNPRSTS